MEPIVTVAYGGGVNSTAMLVGLHNRGEKVDLITFADTGGERPETYAFVERFSKWLTERGMPSITSVQNITQRPSKFRAVGEVLTLERRCLEEHYLPSIAYGFKTCSQRFKKEPQERFIRAWDRADESWKAGNPLVRLYGYDAGEPQRMKVSEDKRFINRYPLIEWGWDREECEEAIAAAGLCVPPKSSCFFCPNMDDHEVLELRDQHPDLLERALAIERNAIPSAGSGIKGLARAYSWQQIVNADESQFKMFPRVRRTKSCDCYDG